MAAQMSEPRFAQRTPSEGGLLGLGRCQPIVGKLAKPIRFQKPFTFGVLTVKIAGGVRYGGGRFEPVFPLGILPMRQNNLFFNFRTLN